MPAQVVVWQDKEAAIRLAPVPVPGGAGFGLTVANL
jgi:hypothetical protein